MENKRLISSPPFKKPLWLLQPMLQILLYIVLWEVSLRILKYLSLFRVSLNIGISITMAFYLYALLSAGLGGLLFYKGVRLKYTLFFIASFVLLTPIIASNVKLWLILSSLGAVSAVVSHYWVSAFKK